METHCSPDTPRRWKRPCGRRRASSKGRCVLARQLAHEEQRRQKPGAGVRVKEQADLAERYGMMIQQYILGTGPEPPAVPEPEEPARTAAKAPGQSS
jgi:hypothetical protein